MLQEIWNLKQSEKFTKVFNEDEGDEEEFKIHFVLQFFSTIFP